jgi:hypothetical protein
MNAINENLAATMARPVAAFPDQDHLAHLQAHLDFIQSPVLGHSRVAAPTAMPILLDHIREHMILWYVSHTVSVASEAAGVDVSGLFKDLSKDERKDYDKMLAAASQSVVKEANEVMKSIPPILEECIQYLQSIQPPQQDPANEAAAAETQRRAAADQQKMQLEAQKMQADQAENAQNIQAKIQELQVRLQEAKMREDREDQRTQMEVAARMKMNTDDNDTAKRLAALEIASGNKVAVSTGTGINPNP